MTRRSRPTNPARRVTCSCGRVCASRSGFATHARRCPIEQARSAAFVEAIEQGRDPLAAATDAVAEALRERDDANPCANCGQAMGDHDGDDVRACEREHAAHLARA